MSGWVRFENTMPENLKVAPVGDKAFRLWVHAICYCSRAQTSGRVPAAIITSLSPSATARTVTELIEAGLVHRENAKTYLVHDYLDYNPSRARIDEMREGSRDRVARHREEKRSCNGVTDPSVTGLQEDYPHMRDRSDTDTSCLSPRDEETRGGRAPSKRVDQHEPPVALPGELHCTAHSVLQVLEAVQTERGGDVPTIRGVGLAMLRCPHRDFLRVAREVEHWALAGRGQRKPVKDWARTFGTFLDNTPEGAPVRDGNVVPMRPSVIDRMNRFELGYPQGGDSA